MAVAELFRTFWSLAVLILRPAQRLRMVVSVAMICELVGLVAAVANPVALKMLVDALTTGEARERVIIIVALFTIAWWLPALMTLLKHAATTRICARLAEALSLVALAGEIPVLGRDPRRDSGTVQGMLERLPFSLQLVIEGVMWQALPLVLQIFGALCIIAYLAPPVYSLITAALLLLVLSLAWVHAAQWRARARASDGAMSALSASLADVLRNAQRIICNGTLRDELAGLKLGLELREKEGRRAAWSIVAISNWQYLAIAAGLAALLFLGSTDVSKGGMSLGTLILLQSYALRLTQPLGSFVFLMMQSGVALTNIAATIELAAQGEMPGDPPRREPGASDIRLERVSFSYGPGLSGVTGIDATIAAGSFVALVGPNGSGKSTLAQLIAGMRDPEAGMVLTGGIDLATVPIHHRYAHIMFVPQFSTLFNRSLCANLLYPPAGHAAGAAQRLLTDWSFEEDGGPIDLMRQLGERGAHLSGGQRQKLELARVAGLSVPALVLDETTSALDQRSALRVIQDLRLVLGKTTTLIMVTHSADIAEQADQVLFMRKGRLVAIERHHRLMQDDLSYRSFWSADRRGSSDIHAATGDLG